METDTIYGYEDDEETAPAAEPTDAEEFPDHPDAPVVSGQIVAKFGIYDEPAANWYLRKQANIAAEIDRIKAQTDAMIRPLLADAERLKLRFEAELEAFARAELAAKGGKGKTITLHQGSISFRTIPAGVIVTDEEAAFAEARTSHPELIQTVEKLDRSGYAKLAKQALDETGEQLPGTDIRPARESMSITFGAGKTRKGAASDASAAE